jgi:hypothetical protein
MPSGALLSSSGSSAGVDAGPSTAEGAMLGRIRRERLVWKLVFFFFFFFTELMHLQGLKS